MEVIIIKVQLSFTFEMTLFGVQLTVSDGDAYDYFGVSVSIHDDCAVVGASGDDGNRGSAYAYHNNGTDWNLEARLIASDGES